MTDTTSSRPDIVEADDPTETGTVDLTAEAVQTLATEPEAESDTTETDAVDLSAEAVQTRRPSQKRNPTLP